MCFVIELINFLDKTFITFYSKQLLSTFIDQKIDFGNYIFSVVINITSIKIFRKCSALLDELNI